MKIISKLEVEVAPLGSTPKDSNRGVVIMPPPIPNIPATIPPKNVKKIILFISFSINLNLELSGNQI